MCEGLASQQNKQVVNTISTAYRGRSPMRRSSRFALAGGLLAACAWAGGLSFGQAPDAALKDRVSQLIEKLDAPKAEARDAAEAALIKLGPRILPLLPDPAKVKGAEAKKRIAKVRTALIEDQEQANLGPSIVTIKREGIRLSEVLKQLQSQSGNVISDLREQFGAEATNPSLDLDIEKKPFFEALDLIAEKAGVTVNFFTGDGTIGLMAGGTASDGQSAPKNAPAPPKPLRIYSGPFRIVFKQFAISKDLQTGDGAANAQFEVAWEPRLRPMLLALRLEDLEIQDDQGKFIGAAVMNEASSVVLRPENPAAELNINLDAPERAAKVLKSLKIKADVTLPAGVKTFRFPSLTAKSSTQKQGDVSVTFDSAEADGETWQVRVTLHYPGEGPAFESYRQGLFNNRVFLQKGDGAKHDNNGGFNQTSSDGGNLGFEYLFVDVPGKMADYGLVYETPSKVLTIPLEIDFKNVPLP
jgi:hypothetical protein